MLAEFGVVIAKKPTNTSSARKMPFCRRSTPANAWRIRLLADWSITAWSDIYLPFSVVMNFINNSGFASARVTSPVIRPSEIA